MEHLALKKLLDKYLEDNLDDREFALLWKTLENPELKETWMQWMDETGANPSFQGLLDKNTQNKMLDQLLPSLTQESVAPIIQSKHFLRTPLFRYAAAIVLVLGTMIYLSVRQSGKEESAQKASKTIPSDNEILPGSDRAILTLANGKKIALDSGANIQLAAFGISNHHSVVSYERPGPAASINTLTTPRGGQYQLKLSDGTNVWLNAESSITYPTTFSAKERTVNITGEAYFEVAANADKPFTVVAGSVRVQVLGTHFDVMAYADETSIKTTLLKGLVKIVNAAGNAVLAPGQQAISGITDNQLKTTEADTEEVMAWKNGLFQFNGADITMVMRQISRWYDVDVQYDGNIPVRHFEGKISRDAKLSEVLNILRLSNVHFSVEGKKIIVQ